MGYNRDKINGKFINTRKPWSVENWDDGYINNRGRFIVLLPEHPKAYGNKYILRSRAVLYKLKNKIVRKDETVHHINGNRLDDNINNLLVIKKKTHDRLHNFEKHIKGSVLRKCIFCKKDFMINRYRLNEGNKAIFCSRNCFYKAGGSHHEERIFN
jgi:hypothetical protein